MAQYRFPITNNNSHHHDQQNKYNLFRILQYILNRVYKICCKDIFLYVQYDAQNQPAKRIRKKNLKSNYMEEADPEKQAAYTS